MKATSINMPLNVTMPNDSESLDCTCEILCDSSLSGISSDSCDCSLCLQANLDAFNDLRQQEQIDQSRNKKTRLQSENKFRTNNQQSTNNRKTLRNDENRENIDSRNIVNRYKSTENFGHRNKWKKNKQSQNDYRQEMNMDSVDIDLDDGELNEFLQITRYRTRKYIQERKKLQNAEKQKKKQLKDKIKKNLELLKMTAQIKLSEENQEEMKHQYPWNHSKYKCECNWARQNQKKHQKQCCWKKCADLRKRTPIDTNLGEIIGESQFENNRDEILQKHKALRLQSFRNRNAVDCNEERCKKHQKIPIEKVRKITKFIEKEAEKYKTKLKDEKKKKEEQRKIKEAKLKAIDLKSKQIVAKSRKYDPNASRTSFKYSIDNFDTFSELREEKERRALVDKVKKDVKLKMAQDGGKHLEEKIYEELEEIENDFEEGFQRYNKGTMLKKEDLGDDGNKDYSSRIMYDAKIKDPQKLNKLEKAQLQKQKVKKKRNLSKTKQQQNTIRLKQQIESKKKQILEEYLKRNGNKQKNPKNKKIREQYQERGQAKRS